MARHVRVTVCDYTGFFIRNLDYSYSCTLRRKDTTIALFRVSNACYLASVFALITGRDKKKGTEHRPVESSSKIGASLYYVCVCLALHSARLLGPPFAEVRWDT